jgi:hypothetical protein
MLDNTPEKLPALPGVAERDAHQAVLEQLLWTGVGG